MAKVLDCSLKESEFKLKSFYHVHLQFSTLRKSFNTLISPDMG